MPSTATVRSQATRETRALPVEMHVSQLRRYNLQLQDALYHARIEKYGTNKLMTFALTYLQHQMVFQDGPRKGEFCAPAAPHQEMTEAITRGLFSEVKRPRIAAMLFRHVGKSTYGTLALALYAVAECGRRNVIILCSTKSEAKDRIANIVEELETNERLRARYPELCPARDRKNQTKSYTDFQIILANGARIKAYEFGRGKLRGSNWNAARPDLVILDDPEPEDFAYSETYRERAWSWLQSVVFFAMSEYGLLVWMGTPIGEESLLNRARQPKEAGGFGWTGPHWPIGTLEMIDGELRWVSSWPAMHDHDDIVDLLNQGGDARIPRQELLLELISLKDKPFDVAWFDEHQYDPALLKKCGDGSFELGGVPIRDIRTWIDSASSTEPTADYTAIITGGLLPSGKAVILDVRHGRFTTPQQLDLLREIYDYWRPLRIHHQKTQIETAIAQFASRETYLPLEPEIVNSAPQAKLRDITNSCVYYRNGGVLFAKGDPAQRPIRNEMAHFPGGHDDCLDTLKGLLGKLLGAPDETVSSTDLHAVGLSAETNSMLGSY